MDASNDGAESVDQFLARIASLSSKQNAEEAERSKRTEEELLQARKERQARRLERARSLSPSKTGPTPSSRPMGEAAPKPNQGIEPPVALTPPLQSRTLGRSGSISPRHDRGAVAGLDFSRPLPAPAPLTSDEPTLPSPPAHATPLSRSGTLSWNQRPLSRGGAVRSRPLSVASIPDLGLGAQSAAQQKVEEEMSRKDIAASLEARDPSWFRQTADRGVGSAAYRKNETDSDTLSHSASRALRLPGMSNAAEDRSKEETEKPTPPSSPSKSAHALPVSQRQPSSSDQTRPRPVSMMSSSPPKPLALDLPTFKPLDLNTSFAADAPGLGRTSSILSSSARPPSPTKGLGGFVESAMMKRSDSVSKRWSVQANAGLKRGDSIASARPAHLANVSGYTPGHSRGSSRDVRGSRDGNSSPLSNSRPVSSHGEPVPITKGRLIPRPEDDSTVSSDTMPKQDAQPSKAVEVPTQTRPVTPPPSESVLSRSPSKTMDPRRWSPTKASWLESALNKPPESPRAAKPEMPAWRLSMQRAKQEQSQLSEATKEELTRPIVAPKPLSTPPMKDATALGKSTGDGVAVDSTSTETGLKKTMSTPLPSSDSSDAKMPGQPFTTTKEEKPVVPAKRNITPVQLGSSSPQKEDSTSATPVRNKQESARGTPNPLLPEHKLESKMAAFKPKPSTPPKPDFRASLKSRQAAPTGSNDAEPEFKAVFGKLKRAQTQSYVAPDELKDNITMGKAALNVTGGPQKTKRVDEFKESILQKKEAMKSGSGAIGKRPEVTSPTGKHNDPVPEALARRMALQKTGTSSEKIETKRQSDTPDKLNMTSFKPQAVAEKPTLSGLGTKPSLGGSKPQSVYEKPVPPKGEHLSHPEPSVAPPTALASNPEKSAAAEVTVLPLQSASDPPARVGLRNSKVNMAEVASSPEPASRVKLPENSKLAARLNPALAGILSRSGSPKTPGDAVSSGGGAIQVRDSQQVARDSTKEDPAALTHMTKARSKGPKRRAPKGSPSTTESGKPTARQPAADVPLKTVGSPEPVLEPKAFLPARSFATKPNVSNSTPERQTAKADLGEVQRPLPMPPRIESEMPIRANLKQTPSPPPKAELPMPDVANTTVEKQSATEPLPAPRTEPELLPKPLVASKSVELRKVSSQGAPTGTVDGLPPLKPKKSVDLRNISGPGTPPKPVDQHTTGKSATPRKIEVLPDPSKVVSSPPDSDGERKATTLSPDTAPVLPLTPNKSRLNTPKAPKPDIIGSTKSRSLASGLGLQLGTGPRNLAAAPVLTPPPEPQAVAPRAAGSPRKSSSPAKSSPSVRPRLESFFGVLPQTGEKAEFDAHAFLSAQNKTAEKSKTLSKQIWEVSGDGKKTPMPPQQEHILFEDCMYVCVHSLQSPSGSKLSEVYLWCGDEVPEAAVEDAQLFCRKVARENSAKLEVVKQGKESSEFFQALGGIVIVRRNKSSALYMLCGRRHLGHIAFDEVDLSADSLRTGLPFLISAKFGKLYLWKGRGSNPEDVGCARLIGMDLGLTGEIEEVSEGEEPASFWDSLSSGSSKRTVRQSSSGTSESHTHPPRLYRVEHDRPKSSGGLGGFWGLRASSPPKQSLKALVEEVAPFNQKDLDGHHIHILDVYRELYVLIGGSAKKPAEFVTAVQVAQEIAVLSPSVQDRPLLPSCYIVIGEPPQHIMSIFRKWTPRRSSLPTEQLCVRAEEVVQELGIQL
ncbi:hypothetical protein PV04_08910 [Phialophora macrospora]|uniref:Uncharacterized protein n=1 Tax=Phialophora macrospora TaxID=1851006 RepID=A0A0D2F7G8_9EURO|nr:hypothetical protein PV04_08910 [Phialophora macrospora]